MCWWSGGQESFRVSLLLQACQFLEAHVAFEQIVLTAGFPSLVSEQDAELDETTVVRCYSEIISQEM